MFHNAHVALVLQDVFLCRILNGSKIHYFGGEFLGLNSLWQENIIDGNFIHILYCTLFPTDKENLERQNLSGRQTIHHFIL